MRIYHGKVVRPIRDTNFDYCFMFYNSLLIRTSTAIRTYLTISSFYSMLKYFAYQILFILAPQYCFKNFAFDNKQAYAASFGKPMQWVINCGGVNRMALMRKPSCMLFSLT